MINYQGASFPFPTTYDTYPYQYPPYSVASPGYHIQPPNQGSGGVGWFGSSFANPTNLPMQTSFPALYQALPVPIQQVSTQYVNSNPQYFRQVQGEGTWLRSDTVNSNSVPTSQPIQYVGTPSQTLPTEMYQPIFYSGNRSKIVLVDSNDPTELFSPAAANNMGVTVSADVSEYQALYSAQSLTEVPVRSGTGDTKSKTDSEEFKEIFPDWLFQNSSQLRITQEAPLTRPTSILRNAGQPPRSPTLSFARETIDSKQESDLSKSITVRPGFQSRKSEIEVGGSSAADIDYLEHFRVIYKSTLDTLNQTSLREFISDFQIAASDGDVKGQLIKHFSKELKKLKHLPTHEIDSPQLQDQLEQFITNISVRFKDDKLEDLVSGVIKERESNVLRVFHSTLSELHETINADKNSTEQSLSTLSHKHISSPLLVDAQSLGSRVLPQSSSAGTIFLGSDQGQGLSSPQIIIPSISPDGSSTEQDSRRSGVGSQGFEPNQTTTISSVALNSLQSQVSKGSSQLYTPIRVNGVDQIEVISTKVQSSTNSKTNILPTAVIQTQKTEYEELKKQFFKDVLDYLKFVKKNSASITVGHEFKINTIDTLELRNEKLTKIGSFFTRHEEFKSNPIYDITYNPTINLLQILFDEECRNGAQGDRSISHFDLPIRKIDFTTKITSDGLDSQSLVEQITNGLMSAGGNIPNSQPTKLSELAGVLDALDTRGLTFSTDTKSQECCNTFFMNDQDEINLFFISNFLSPSIVQDFGTRFSKTKEYGHNPNSYLALNDLTDSRLKDAFPIFGRFLDAESSLSKTSSVDDFKRELNGSRFNQRDLEFITDDNKIHLYGICTALKAVLQNMNVGDHKSELLAFSNLFKDLVHDFSLPHQANPQLPVASNERKDILLKFATDTKNGEIDYDFLLKAYIYCQQEEIPEKFTDDHKLKLNVWLSENRSNKFARTTSFFDHPKTQESQTYKKFTDPDYDKNFLKYYLPQTTTYQDSATPTGINQVDSVNYQGGCLSCEDHPAHSPNESKKKVVNLFQFTSKDEHCTTDHKIFLSSEQYVLLNESMNKTKDFLDKLSQTQFSFSSDDFRALNRLIKSKLKEKNNGAIHFTKNNLDKLINELNGINPDDLRAMLNIHRSNQPNEKTILSNNLTDELYGSLMADHTLLFGNSVTIERVKYNKTKTENRVDVSSCNFTGNIVIGGQPFSVIEVKDNKNVSASNFNPANNISYTQYNSSGNVFSKSVLQMQSDKHNQYKKTLTEVKDNKFVIERDTSDTTKYTLFHIGHDGEKNIVSTFEGISSIDMLIDRSSKLPSITTDFKKKNPHFFDNKTPKFYSDIQVKHGEKIEMTFKGVKTGHENSFGFSRVQKAPTVVR
jgi:hypothetical protein